MEMNEKPRGLKKSSFSSIDSNKLFSLLELQQDTIFLDLGCGGGHYSIAASERIGEDGRIYAVDRFEDSIHALKETIRKGAIENITAIQADISKKIPVENHTVDICLMAGVFHHLVDDHSHKNTLEEIVRTLKPGGLLAFVEFKKMDGPPGPPIQMRISSDELETIVAPFGFQKKISMAIGPHHYLGLFVFQE